MTFAYFCGFYFLECLAFYLGLKVKVNSLSRVRLFFISGTVVCQVAASMGFPRQECSGLLFPSPEDLLDMGTETESPTLLADSEKSEPPGKPLFMFTCCNKNLRNVY